MKNVLKTVMLLAALFVIIPGCDDSTTIPGPDTTPPAWDDTAGITGITPGDTTLTISWGAASDTESPPVVYFLFIDTNSNPWDQAPIEVQTNAPYVFTGLVNGTEYWFGVRCRDSYVAPNSDDNAVVLSSIPAIQDAEPPVWDATTGLTSIDENGNDVTLNWGTAIDALSPPVQYLVYVDNDMYPWDRNPVVLDNNDPYTFTGLDETKNHWFGVRCHDSWSDPNVDANEITLSVQWSVQPDPSNPQLAGLSDAFDANDFAVQDDYVYIANENGIGILDFSDPANPSIAGSLDLSLPYGASYIDVEGDYVYLSDNDAFYVIDVSDPANPILAYTHVANGTHILDITAAGNYLYAVFNDGTNSGLRIFDVSAPSSPIELDSLELAWDFNSMSTHEARILAIDGDYAYVATHHSDFRFHTNTDIIHVCDINDPADIMKVSVFDLPSITLRTPVVENGTLYFVAHMIVGHFESDYRFGTWDVSNTAAPLDIGVFDLCDEEASFDVASGYAYIHCTDNLQVFDVSDPANPVPYCSIPVSATTGDGVQVVDNHVYIDLDGSGISCFQLW